MKFVHGHILLTFVESDLQRKLVVINESSLELVKINELWPDHLITGYGVHILRIDQRTDVVIITRWIDDDEFVRDLARRNHVLNA